MNQPGLTNSEELQLLRRMREVFVKDAITECAVDHLARELKQAHLVQAFAQRYCPDRLGYAALSSRSASPDAQLRPLLEQFVDNMSATEPSTKISNREPRGGRTPEELIQLFAREVCEATVHLPYYSNQWDHHTQRPRQHKQTALDIYLLTMTAGLAQLQQSVQAPPPKPLQANMSGLKHIGDLLEDAEAKTIFTLGGSIKLDSAIAMRYDDSAGVIGKTCFGSGPDSGTDLKALCQLMNTCDEASFGLAGKDVLDKQYRDALKLDPTQFSINFHPADHGIVNEIDNVLLGNVDKKLVAGSVHCELYKLNIYGPGGHFKSHVDTPRSPAQFGSLVVSLPFPHSGGSLSVSHYGRSIDYSWGHSQDIEWAAFYSDCEHEVSEVISGYRVTLTYNLYWHIPAEHRVLRPDTLPIMHELHPLLTSDTFLPAGGVVGFFCKHAYARHRAQSGSQETFRQLKGVDHALFLTLQASGLSPTVRPVLEQKKVREDAEEYEECRDFDGDSMDHSSNMDRSEQDGRHEPDHFHSRRRAALLEVQQKLRATGETLLLDYADSKAADSPDMRCASFQDRLAFVLSHRTIKDFPAPEEDREGTVDRIGSASGDIGLYPGECQGIDEKYEMLDAEWPIVRNIHWLNEPRNEEVSLAYMAYGNQAELDHYYSSAAILFYVPAYAQRGRRSLAATPEAAEGRSRASEATSEAGVSGASIHDPIDVD